MNNTFTFIGHSDAPGSILSQVLFAIENLINENDETVFLNGGMGSFDKLCGEAVRKAKKAHPKKSIKLCLVLPSYQYAPKPNESGYLHSLYDEVFVCSESDGAHFKAMIGKRNRWMVDQSCAVISYVHKEYGGAFQTLNYAKKKGVKIINIKKEKV